MFSKQLVNIENIVELANLILAQHTSEAGLKKLELILAILADEKVEVINEATHFAMPKKQK